MQRSSTVAERDLTCVKRCHLSVCVFIMIGGLAATGALITSLHEMDVLHLCLQQGMSQLGLAAHWDACPGASLKTYAR
jgi:hypothetical protein